MGTRVSRSPDANAPPRRPTETSPGHTWLSVSQPASRGHPPGSYLPLATPPYQLPACLPVTLLDNCLSTWQLNPFFTF